MKTFNDDIIVQDGASDPFILFKNPITTSTTRGVAAYEVVKPGLTTFLKKVLKTFPVISGK